MNHISRSLPLAAIALASLSQAQNRDCQISRDQIEPVILLDTLDVRDSREGDLFYARPKEVSRFPLGTKFEGRINRIREDRRSNRGDRTSGSMDVEFVAIVFPNGARAPMKGFPCNLRDTRRTNDGRLVGSMPRDRRLETVGIGAAAGYILGGTQHKSWEGAFLGTIASAIYADNQYRNQRNSSIVARRGDEIGVWFDRDFRYNWGDGRDDRDRDRDDRFNDRRFPELRCEGRALRYDNCKPIYRDRTLYVPLFLTARQVGVTVTDVRDSSLVLMEFGDDLLRIDRMGRNYRFNGRRGELPGNMYEDGGQIFVPIEAFDTLAPGRVEVRYLR